jgi:hypothetical protein
MIRKINIPPDLNHKDETSIVILLQNFAISLKSLFKKCKLIEKLVIRK